MFQGFCEDKELAILQNWVKAKLLASLAKWMNLHKWLQRSEAYGRSVINAVAVTFIEIQFCSVDIIELVKLTEIQF